MAVTKEARIEPSDWSGKVGVVEKVKRIRAELDHGAFGDLRLLLQGEVHVPETGTVGRLALALVQFLYLAVFAKSE